MEVVGAGKRPIVNAQVRTVKAGEPACRPGSVRPGFLTCRYSPANSSDLCFCLPTVAIDRCPFTPSGGTGTELGPSAVTGAPGAPVATSSWIAADQTAAGSDWSTGLGSPSAQWTRTVWCFTWAPFSGSILKPPNRVDVSKSAAATHSASRLVPPASLAQRVAITAPAATCTAG